MHRASWSLFLVAALGCGISDEGRSPPDDSLFFPTGVVTDPTGSLLYVTNGNTDLRFNGGSLAVVDFAATLAAYTQGRCTARDPLTSRIAVCLEAAPPAGLGLVLRDRTLRTGSFAGQPTLQHFQKPRLGPNGRPAGTSRLMGCTPPCGCDPTLPATDPAYDPTCVPLFDPDPAQGMRLLVPVRGDPSLTWINVAPDGHLDCGQPPGAVGACDANHRLTVLFTDTKMVLPPEPFGVAVSDGLGFAVTSHTLPGGADAVLSLFDIGDTPSFAPAFVSFLPGAFDPSPSGSRGAYAVAVRPFDPVNLPAACEGYPRCNLADFVDVYATSRYSPRIGQFVVRGTEPCRPGLGDLDTCPGTPRSMTLLPGPQVHVDLALSDGSDVRDIKFNRDGTRAYVLDRLPPSLLEVDTSASPPPVGDPRNRILRITEVCSDPSLLALREDPGPLRIYVTCFSAGQIFVIDPSLGDVLDAIDVGRGPNAVVLVPGRPRRGVVANFADNDLAVLDLEPGSPTENLVLFKIGMPNPILGTTMNQ